MGMIASSPATPVVAAATGMVPLYDVPIMPTLPVAHVAFTSSVPVAVANPFARPLSQSITAFGARRSGAPPTVAQPSERPVPGASERTTAKPLDTHEARESRAGSTILVLLAAKPISGCD